MAATIASTAILISAQTAPLARDMRTAQKIVGDGAQKMKDEVDRKGSMWGSFFRTAFAVAMFKRLVRSIREGTEELKKSGDAGAEAAAKGLKAYDDAIRRIEMSLAKALAPAIANIGEGIADTSDALEDLIDVWQFAIINGKGDQGLVDELGRRIEIIERLKRERAAKNAADFEAKDRFDKFMAGAKKIRPLFDEIITPLEKHLELVDLITRRVVDEGQAAKMLANERDKLRKSMGLEKELSDIEQFHKKVDDLQAFKRLGYMEDLEFYEMLGAAIEKLAAGQKALENKPPEALIRGTAAAFSAINAFQRGGETKKDAAAIIAAGQKRGIEQRDELIRLGKEAARANVKVVTD